MAFSMRSNTTKKLQDEENRFEQVQRIALEIIDEARIQLMMKFRFLDVALWKMEPRLTDKIGQYTLATDGTFIYFDPYTVIGRFDANFNEVARDYLHSVMHCLFRHPYDMTRANFEAWWLVCDVLAENAAMELCGKRFESPLDVERRAALEELRGLCGGKLTPGNLYGLFVRSLRGLTNPTELRVSGARLNELHTLFERDYHRGWPSYRPDLKIELSSDDSATVDDSSTKRESDARDSGSGGDSNQVDESRQDVYDLSEGQDFSDSSSADGQNAEGDDDEGASNGETGDSEGASDNYSGEVDRSEQDANEVNHRVVEHEETNEEERSWEELSKQVETDLETFSASWGYEAGDFIKLLSAANRKKTDYSDFLRRFAALSEEMKINDDEFDYIFYTYGLRLYGNMPLIEPLEYKETNHLREFVICIDTSESCDGELIKSFVEHTFNILKKQEDFSHEVNIHVIQCDSKVQSDTKISDLRDVDRFMETFTVRGLGGTDFRPAFSYVDALKHEGELSDLKGLIYFTDGLGDFPEAVPDYDTAFVFLDDGENHIPTVPPWAMRVLVDEEGINRQKSKLR